jgi:transcription elongation GreA/GreB family factor
MNIYVITAEDRDRLNEFFSTYRPFLHTEVEQMRLLKKKLSDAVIVPESKLSRTVVSMHTTATVVNLDQREAQRYTLTYPQQASVSYGLLSILSPLGAALLGCAEGDVFECMIPTGPVKFAIKEILYQPAWDLLNRHGHAEVAPAL